MWQELRDFLDHGQDKELIVRVLAIRHRYFLWWQKHVLYERSGRLTLRRHPMMNRPHLILKSGYAKNMLSKRGNGSFKDYKEYQRYERRTLPFTVMG